MAGDTHYHHDTHDTNRTESASELNAEVSELCLEDLERTARSANGDPALPLRDWVALAESWRIVQALREARGNRSAAARALGIGRRTLYSKMEKLGLVPSWGVTRPGPTIAKSPLSVSESIEAQLPQD